MLHDCGVEVDAKTDILPAEGAVPALGRRHAQHDHVGEYDM